MGLAMGLTAVIIIYSPWGRRSGAHLNSAAWQIGRKRHARLLSRTVHWRRRWNRIGCADFEDRLLGPTILATATVPGPAGEGIALLAEIALTFVLMTVVLKVSNTPRIAKFAGRVVGVLVGDTWSGMWIYFVAPPVGMLLAVEGYLWQHDSRSIGCAKMHHDLRTHCIFCEYQRAKQRRAIVAQMPDPEEVLT